MRAVVLPTCTPGEHVGLVDGPSSKALVRMRTHQVLADQFPRSSSAGIFAPGRGRPTKAWALARDRGKQAAPRRRLSAGCRPSCVDQVWPSLGGGPAGARRERA